MGNSRVGELPGGGTPGWGNSRVGNSTVDVMANIKAAGSARPSRIVSISQGVRTYMRLIDNRCSKESMDTVNRVRVFVAAFVLVMLVPAQGNIRNT